MNYKKMVKELFKGSENIDQMKKEINFFFSMMNGIIQGYVSRSPWVDEPYKVEKIFKSWSGYTWVLIMQKEHTDDRKANITYSFSDVKEEINPFYRYSYRSDSSCPLDLDNTSEVYKALPVLLKGLLKEFPTMKYQYFDNFIKASKVKF